jgi:hypothetical protein
MAVLDKEKFMERLKERIGEDTSDDALQFIEDMADTYNDLEERVGEDWKTKYEESEKTWRDKYKQRFFTSTETATETEEEEEETNKPKKFEDLFE